MLHRKVLIVNDDADVRRLLAHWLARADYDVTEAVDGREALEIAHRDCPHFLITDWDMPQLDGLELCRRIRQEGFPHYVYTVLLTGRTDVGDMILALETGADDLLTKPVTAPELLARLRAGARVVELENQLLRLARTDPLTGIPNRWVFFEHVERELARARRHNLPLACVLCDIDFFKTVNDTHGHVVGDAVLKAFGQSLQAQCRANDYICRYGGEEFCVLLTETDERVGAEWAERVRAALRELAVPAHGKLVTVTASFGVAGLPDAVPSAEELIDHADHALRVAEHGGRDRVVRYSELGRADEEAAAHLDGYRLLFRDLAARDLMTPPLLLIDRRQSMLAAAELFLRTGVGSAPVVDSQGKLVGIVSEKDLMSATPWLDGGRSPVERVMKEHVVSYPEETPAAVIYDFLCRVAIRRVIIVQDGVPTGIISRASLLRWLGNWQKLGLTRPIALSDSAREAWLRQQLALPLAELETEVERLREQLASGEMPPDVDVVSRLTRIQQLTSNLTSLAHRPDALAAADLAAPAASN